MHVGENILNLLAAVKSERDDSIAGFPCADDEFVLPAYLGGEAACCGPLPGPLEFGAENPAADAGGDFEVECG